jgi:hypothetical protein
VVWQTIGNFKAKDKPDQAVLAFAKVKEILNNRDKNEGTGKIRQISFEENPLIYQSHGPNSGYMFPGLNRK